METSVLGIDLGKVPMDETGAILRLHKKIGNSDICNIDEAGDCGCDIGLNRAKANRSKTAEAIRGTANHSYADNRRRDAR